MRNRIYTLKGINKNQSGFSVVSLLVSILISGLVVKVAFAQLVVVNTTFTKFFKDSEVNKLRIYISSSIDCEKTLSKMNSCKPGTFLELASKSNTRPVLVKNFHSDSASNGSQLGQYALRASCQECINCTNGKKITVEYKTEFGKKNKSKLDGKSLNEWKDISQGLAPISCVVP